MGPDSRVGYMNTNPMADILAQLKAPRSFTIEEIAVQIGASADMTEHMIEGLQHLGYLRDLSLAGNSCRHCRNCSGFTGQSQRGLELTPKGRMYLNYSGSVQSFFDQKDSQNYLSYMNVEEKKLVTLDTMKEGQKGIIHSLEGGGSFISRISAMGFTPNTTVTMVSRRPWGPVLVYLRDTEVALGRREAGRITVRRAKI